MDEKPMKKQVKTYKNSLKSVKRAKTARVGRRGLFDLEGYYNGLTGFNLNTMGVSEHVTTYGEVSNAGIMLLVDNFKRHAPLSKIPTDRRNFFDLGCGIGKIVVGVALLVPEIRSNGIEIVSERVRIAQTALSRIHSKQLSNRIQIRQGSFLDTGIAFGTICWIFM